MQHDSDYPPQGALRQAGRQRRLARLGPVVGTLSLVTCLRRTATEKPQ